MRGSFGALVFTIVCLSGCDPTATPIDAPPSDTGPVGDVADLVCVDDESCSDGLFCNGGERCRPGAAGADERGCVSAIDVTPCLAGQTCEESGGSCVTECSVSRDADGDGSEAIECGGDDCDDSRGDVSPEADEVCDVDQVDEDCDPMTIGARDVDGDGAVDGLCCNADTSLPSGLRCGTDCDDTHVARRPGATEICNVVDDDCDGAADEGVQTEGYADEDRDLHGDPAAPLSSCIGDPGLSLLDDDCDDTDPRAHGAQIELCDGRDNDCDGMIDEAARALTWYRDVDGDGFGSAESGTTVTCVPPTGHSLLGTDCDDADRAVSPIAREVCNGRDDDCNGVADYRIGAGDFEDDDGDGHADLRCRFIGDDCDDRDPFSHGGALEICDLRDNDCDDTVDEDAAARSWLADDDGDGFGDPLDAMSSCELVAGRVLRTGDCDDTLASVFPGALDGCGMGEGRDDDCDDRIDEAGARTAFYVDGDSDTFGAGTPVLTCSAPSGRVASPGDCDDTTAARSPVAAEVCANTIDDDCDGAVDCADGACSLLPACGPVGTAALTVTTGADQSAMVTTALGAPITLVLTNGSGALVRGATVTVAGPANSFWYPTSAQTDSLGRVQFLMFVGRTTGSYRWTFSTAGLAPVSVDATALPAEDGSITRPIDAADTGERPTTLPAASVGVSLETITGTGFLPDGRILVADNDLSCVLQVSPSGIASAFAGRCRLSGMGGGGATCTVAGDGGQAVDATLCDIDAMLVDAPRNAMYLVDLRHGQLRRVDLTTGVMTLLASGAIDGPFLPANIGPDGRIFFVQSVLEDTATPTSLLVFDPVAGTVSGAEAFSGDPYPPTYGTDYREEEHTEPMGFLPGPTEGSLVVRGETCNIPKDGLFYGIDLIDPSGVPLTAGCGRDTATVGTASLVRIAGRPTALGLDEGGSPLVATVGVDGVGLHRVGHLDRVVRALPLDLIDPIQMITASAVSVLVATDETVIELRGVAADDLDTTVVASGPTLLNAIATEDVDALFTTSTGSARVRAVSSTPGGGTLGDGFAVSSGVGDGLVSLRAGWNAGDYLYTVGPVDVFGVGLSGASYTLRATAPSPGTLTTLLGYPYFISGGFDDRGFVADDGPAVSLTLGLVTSVAIAADGTTYVGVSGSTGGLFEITPAGELSRMDRGATQLVGPLANTRFGRVSGLALDETRDALYVVDVDLAGTGTQMVIWRIDLSTRVVTRWAGTASGGSFADGTPRLGARIEGASTLSLGPDGTLYFGARTAVGGRSSLRYISPGSETMQTLVPASGGGACGTVALYDCAEPGCAVVFPPSGDLIIVGNLCGSDLSCGAVSMGGVLRRTSAGVLSHVAGSCTFGTTPGLAPTSTRLTSARGALLDGPDAVLVGAFQSGLTNTYVWRIPLSGGVTSVVAGNGLQSDDPDPRSGPALSTPVRAPRAFARRPDGRLVFADEYSLRMVW
jgi:hypothetical protein